MVHVVLFSAFKVCCLSGSGLLRGCLEVDGLKGCLEGVVEGLFGGGCCRVVWRGLFGGLFIES